MLVVFTNLGFMEFQVRYLASLRVVPDGKSLQEYQLTLEFFKARFLFQHFSYYTLMTFLMMLYVILSMLMILLSTLSLIRYLDLWQQLELASRLESNL